MEELKGQVIETERLILRFVQSGDAEDIFEYAKDEETGPRAGWSPHKNIEKTKELINDWINMGEGEGIFVIVKKENMKVIGTTCVLLLGAEKTKNSHQKIKNILNVNGNIFELGCIVSKTEWGKGYGTEAFAGMQKMLFENAKADAIVASCYELNISSAKVQEKNHMRILFEEEKGATWLNTNSKKVFYRGITKKEWLYLQNNREL